MVDILDLRDKRVRKTAWGPVRTEEGGFEFRLWAPALEGLSLRINQQTIPMAPEGDGWYSVVAANCTYGDTYFFVLPDGQTIPDPASRFQPKGVVGPSQLMDCDAYAWNDEAWTGRPWQEAVLYELHVGTFTSEGTYRAAAERLEWVASLGFTAIEIMPLAEFPGRRGWGYDGVYHFAPCSKYGNPDELKAFIDRAHALGLMVILDVVYNHFGPEGNFLETYAPDFFSRQNKTPWGSAIRFENKPVRHYFLENIAYWLAEFHIDGFRVDAFDQMADPSPLKIGEEIARLIGRMKGQRHCYLITEDATNSSATGELNDLEVFAADWNDDFHHALHCAVTGERKGHYKAFADGPWQHAGNALAHGYIRRDDDDPMAVTWLEEFEPTSYIHFLQNHDQVGNRAQGDRLYHNAETGVFACMTAILVLSPQIPLMFMGDDHLSRQPFFYFCDFAGKLAEDVRRGRLSEAENFGNIPRGFTADDVADPNDEETFLRSKLNWDDAAIARPWSEYLKGLLTLRQKHIVPLLKAPGHRMGHNRSIERHIWVEWTLGNDIVSLQANFSDQPRPVSNAEGDLIFPAKPRTTDLIDPLTVHCYIRHVTNAGEAKD